MVEGLRAQAPGATHYVVFDACRNELNLTRKGRKALTDKGFVPITYTPGVVVAYATAPGRTASDIGSGGGTYAKALADEIVKPGVDLMLVFTRVARRVQREIGQDPFLSASTMPEVYFAGEATGPAAAPTQPQASEAMREWSRVDKSSVVELETFLRRHSGSAEADYARARLEEFKKQKSRRGRAASSQAACGCTLQSCRWRDPAPRERATGFISTSGRAALGADQARAVHRSGRHRRRRRPDGAPYPGRGFKEQPDEAAADRAEQRWRSWHGRLLGGEESQRRPAQHHYFPLEPFHHALRHGCALRLAGFYSGRHAGARPVHPMGEY